MALSFQTPTLGSIAFALVSRDVHLSHPAPVSFKWGDVSPQYSRAPEGATVHGGAVIFLKGVVARTRSCARVPSASGPQPLAAAGTLVSEGRPSASFGRGMKIQGPKCAFEPSMFLCPAVHMSTRNLLRFSSTHETSGRILSDVSSLLHHHHHRTGPIHFRRWSVGLPPLGRTRQHAARDTQGIASSF